MSFIMNWGFTDTPEGSDNSGWWRVGAGDSPNGDLSEVIQMSNKFGLSLPLYSGDFGAPGTVVLFYQPGFNQANVFQPSTGQPGSQSFECVLVGNVPPSSLESQCPNR